MSAQPYSFHVTESVTVPAPRRFFMVTRPNDSRLRYFYQTRAEAEIICAGKEIDSPEIGPWEIIEVVEVLP